MSGTGINGLIVSCSLDKTAKVFNAFTGKLCHNIIGDTELTSVCMNLTGSQLFLGDKLGKVHIINLLPHTDTTDLEVTILYV